MRAGHERWARQVGAKAGDANADAVRLFCHLQFVAVAVGGRAQGGGVFAEDGGRVAVGEVNALSGADDACFFAGDAVNGVAEPVLVVKADAGDDGGFGVDEVGRVQPAAKADFEYGDLRLAAGDEVEGGKC